MIEATLLFPLACAVLAVLGMPLWTATGRDIVVAGMLGLVLSVLIPETASAARPTRC